jgi:nicotinamide-nucleotide amidase
MNFDSDTVALAERVLKACRARGEMLATAESCTGGLIAGALTAIAGSSRVLDRGFITYSYAAKEAMLGVDHELLHANGAVSEPVARAMAAGAVAHSYATLALAVTGVAGPGASEDKPAGLVHFGAQVDGTVHHDVQNFTGDRAQVREAAVRHALGWLLGLLGEA